MLFRDIPGHEAIKGRLIQTVLENRVSHAWLFHGPEGAGAFPMALAFAAYLVCTNRGKVDSCGVCAACNKSGKLIHPDVHFVYPVNVSSSNESDHVAAEELGSEWRSFVLENSFGRLNQWYEHIGLENKQGMISSDESRRLAYKMSLKPFESDHKVVVIWHPEKMNDTAANRLLKLLEEPPPMTVFILVAEQPDMLLTTVRSRCTPLRIPRLQQNELSGWLVEKTGLGAEKASELARVSEGNYKRAMELLSAGENEQSLLESFRTLMRACFSRNVSEILKASEEISSFNRENQKAFLQYGLGIVRESLALHYHHSGIVYLSGEENDFVPRFAPFITGENVDEIQQIIGRAIQDIERNGNGRIIFLDLALKVSRLIQPRRD